MLIERTLWQFGFELGHAGAVHLHGHEIGIWEIAVVVRLFLTAERGAGAGLYIPAAGLLVDLATVFENLGLTGNLIFDRCLHIRHRVQVLHLGAGAECFGADGTNRDVGVATHLALLHIAVAHAAIHENVLEGIQVGIGHIGAGDLGFGNDFEQGHTATVEVHAAVFVKMGTLADVFFQVSPIEIDPLDAAFEFELHIASNVRGQGELRDLVILGGVRIEVVLAIKLCAGRDIAIEQHPGERRLFEGLFIRHRKRSGHAEADRAYVRVGIRTVLVRTTAPHLGAGSQLDVGFQSDDGFVFHLLNSLNDLLRSLIAYFNRSGFRPCRVFGRNLPFLRINVSSNQISPPP